MKIQCALVALVALVLASLMLTGTFLAEQFPQAAHAQSTGFDALAHNLFDDALASK